jgi:hypothetical protein
MAGAVRDQARKSSAPRELMPNRGQQHRVCPVVSQRMVAHV